MIPFRSRIFSRGTFQYYISPLSRAFRGQDLRSALYYFRLTPPILILIHWISAQIRKTRNVLWNTKLQKKNKIYIQLLFIVDSIWVQFRLTKFKTFKHRELSFCFFFCTLSNIPNKICNSKLFETGYWHTTYTHLYVTVLTNTDTDHRTKRRTYITKKYMTFFTSWTHTIAMMFPVPSKSVLNNRTNRHQTHTHEHNTQTSNIHLINL